MKGTLLGTVSGLSPLQFHKEKQFNSLFPPVWVAPTCFPQENADLFVDMLAILVLAGSMVVCSAL